MKDQHMIRIEKNGLLMLNYLRSRLDIWKKGHPHTLSHTYILKERSIFEEILLLYSKNKVEVL